MKVLDSLPEVSVAFDPFGSGQDEVMKHFKIEEPTMYTKNIHDWADDVFTYAAAKKEYDNLTPAQCAIGFKLIDYQMGGMHTARMLAESPHIYKVIPNMAAK
jgi:hypothetical protein